MQTNGTADEEAQMSIMREHLLNAGLHVEGELLFFAQKNLPYPDTEAGYCQVEWL